MMDEGPYTSWIGDYLDDALTDEERAAFESRMAEDEELRAAVEAERKLLRLLASAPRPRAPEGFERQVMERVRASQEATVVDASAETARAPERRLRLGRLFESRPAYPPARLRHWAELAAAVLVLAVGIGVYRSIDWRREFAGRAQVSESPTPEAPSALDYVSSDHPVEPLAPELTPDLDALKEDIGRIRQQTSGASPTESPAIFPKRTDEKPHAEAAAKLKLKTAPGSEDKEARRARAKPAAAAAPTIGPTPKPSAEERTAAEEGEAVSVGESLGAKVEKNEESLPPPAVKTAAAPPQETKERAVTEAKSTPKPTAAPIPAMTPAPAVGDNFSLRSELLKTSAAPATPAAIPRVGGSKGEIAPLEEPYPGGAGAQGAVRQRQELGEKAVSSGKTGSSAATNVYRILPRTSESASPASPSAISGQAVAARGATAMSSPQSSVLGAQSSALGRQLPVSASAGAVSAAPVSTPAVARLSSSSYGVESTPSAAPGFAGAGERGEASGVARQVSRAPSELAGPPLSARGETVEVRTPKARSAESASPVAVPRASAGHEAAFQAKTGAPGAGPETAGKDLSTVRRFGPGEGGPPGQSGSPKREAPGRARPGGGRKAGPLGPGSPGGPGLGPRSGSPPGGPPSGPLGLRRGAAGPPPAGAAAPRMGIERWETLKAAPRPPTERAIPESLMAPSVESGRPSEEARPFPTPAPLPGPTGAPALSEFRGGAFGAGEPQAATGAPAPAAGLPTARKELRVSPAPPGKAVLNAPAPAPGAKAVIVVYRRDTESESAALQRALGDLGKALDSAGGNIRSFQTATRRGGQSLREIQAGLPSDGASAFASRLSGLGYRREPSLDGESLDQALTSSRLGAGPRGQQAGAMFYELSPPESTRAKPAAAEPGKPASAELVLTIRVVALPQP